MANYYYVKSGGAAVGDAGRVAGTKSTGSFATKGAAAYYDNILATNSATTPPAQGDFVLISNIHDHNYAATTQLQLRDGVAYISVDDTALDTYLKGGIERTTGSTAYDFHLLSTSIDKVVYSKGMIWKSENEIYICSTETQLGRFEDCEFHLTGTSGGDRVEISNTQDGSIVHFKDCVFNFGGTSQMLRILGGNRAILDNCSVVGGNSGMFEIGGWGGGLIEIHNSDLTGLGATPTIVHGGSASSDDMINLTMTRCLVPAGTSYLEGSISNKSNKVECRSIGVGTGSDNYFQFYEGNPFFGAIEQDTTVYRDNANGYDKVGNKLSGKLITTAEAIRTQPAKATLAFKAIDTDDYTGTVTVKVYIARDGSATPFTDEEVWAELVYQDGDTRALGAKISTEAQILSTPANITADAEAWTGLGGTNNTMTITFDPLTIGTNPGDISTGAIAVNLYCALPSEAVYGCTTLGVS